jgi:hypothetical protein
MLYRSEEVKVVGYMTIAKFSEETGLSRTRVYVALGAGDLKAVKLGKRVLIDIAHAAKWLASQPPAEIRVKAAA